MFKFMVYGPTASLKLLYDLKCGQIKKNYNRALPQIRFNCYPCNAQYNKSRIEALLLADPRIKLVIYKADGSIYFESIKHYGWISNEEWNQNIPSNEMYQKLKLNKFNHIHNNNHNNNNNKNNYKNHFHPIQTTNIHFNHYENNYNYNQKYNHHHHHHHHNNNNTMHSSFVFFSLCFI